LDIKNSKQVNPPLQNVLSRLTTIDAISSREAMAGGGRKTAHQTQSTAYTPQQSAAKEDFNHGDLGMKEPYVMYMYVNSRHHGKQQTSRPHT
jgi:hypothetical protein